MQDGDTGIQPQRDAFVVYGDFSINIMTADNQSQVAGRSVINSNNGIVLSASERALIEALREYGPQGRILLRRLIGMIDDLARCLPSGEEGSTPGMGEDAAGVVKRGEQVG